VTALSSTALSILGSAIALLLLIGLILFVVIRRARRLSTDPDETEEEVAGQSTSISVISADIDCEWVNVLASDSPGIEGLPE
jgi:hypothetical protein